MKVKQWPERQKPPTLMVGGEPLYVGSKLECNYMNKVYAEVTTKATKRAHILHAILWPTIIFIGGFVGLFFSCIMLQKMKSQRSQPQVTHV